MQIKMLRNRVTGNIARTLTVSNQKFISEISFVNLYCFGVFNLNFIGGKAVL